MTEYNSLKNQDRIQEVKPDKSKAKGLLKKSEKRFKIQKEKEVTERNSFEILENLYESLRECIEAAMSAEGLKAEDHVAASLTRSKNFKSMIQI